MASTEKTTDRYKTFIGIDCDGNAKRVIQLLRRHIDDPQKGNPFWDKFKEGLPGADGERKGRNDELFLVHAYINNIRELFEEYDDHEALILLQQLEEECC